MDANYGDQELDTHPATDTKIKSLNEEWAKTQLVFFSFFFKNVDHNTGHYIHNFRHKRMGITKGLRKARCVREPK